MRCSRKFVFVLPLDRQLPCTGKTWKLDLNQVPYSVEVVATLRRIVTGFQWLFRKTISSRASQQAAIAIFRNASLFDWAIAREFCMNLELFKKHDFTSSTERAAVCTIFLENSMRNGLDIFIIYSIHIVFLLAFDFCRRNQMDFCQVGIETDSYR